MGLKRKWLPDRDSIYDTRPEESYSLHSLGESVTSHPVDRDFRGGNDESVRGAISDANDNMLYRLVKRWTGRRR